MKNKIEVNKQFISKSLEMAEDLYGLATMCKGNGELRKSLKSHINNCKKYLTKLEDV
jgi:hypothetical protein